MQEKRSSVGPVIAGHEPAGEWWRIFTALFMHANWLHF